METEIDLSELPLQRVPTQARSREKVRRALEAAEHIAETEGPEALSLTHVAERAGLSVGALYQYLPDREAITAAVQARCYLRLERYVDEALAQGPPSPHRDGDPLDSMLAIVANSYAVTGLARALHAVAPSPEQAAARREHKRRMAERTESALRAFDLLPDGVDAARVARIVYVTVDAHMHDAADLAQESDDPDTEYAGRIREVEKMLAPYLRVSARAADVTGAS
ncbi:TetR/AcrR family transcriptional regulator [Serinibacter salmoneus]|uniref:TetR family transcriptional regulator n=1 Tax=Serinibacter salmoneus TaxID=556530 RepID=A0A2A9D2C3_9MICO|nr:TetR/AcrR family transcriptional regulator [Serinibacter salmoneus]PFG20868.1 TetR family transcriptional regulator [Serinibacter salmoneus]